MVHTIRRQDFVVESKLAGPRAAGVVQDSCVVRTRCWVRSRAPVPVRFWASGLHFRVPEHARTGPEVEDANMPSDFLTKWLPSAKLRKSVAYATNSQTRAP